MKYDILPVEKIIKEWKSWQDIFESWSLEELQGNTRSYKNLTLGIHVNPYRVPFIDYIGGNFIGIDLMPGPDGKVGQIIRFGADINTIAVAANNLNELFKLAIHQLESSDE